MALIDKETICKEIERRIENCVKNVNHRPCHRIEELCELLAFLDTLPEQPASEGLEEEIKRFLSNATKMNKGEWRGKYPISDIGFRAVARHFVEWGAEHLKK